MKKLITLASAFLSFNALAVQQGDWIFHVRAINVSPDDDSSAIRVDGGPVAGTGVTVDSGLSLDLSFAYMFTDRWAVELLADISSKHSASSVGLGGLGVPDGTELVEANVLPPTVFLQYQFNPTGSVRPYAGLGINHTLFFSEDLTPAAEAALGADNLDMDSSTGLAGQFGIDFDINDNWFFSVDIKYINIDTTASFDTALGRASVDVDINPWVFGLGFGTTF